MQYNLSVISLRSLTSHPQFEPEASLRLWLASFSSHRPSSRTERGSLRSFQGESFWEREARGSRLLLRGRWLPAGQTEGAFLYNAAHRFGVGGS